MGHCVALYRKPAYSPQQHLANDTAILNAVVAELEPRGWRVSRASEADLETGAPPAANLYLNMCQGAAASERLVALEHAGRNMAAGPPKRLSIAREPASACRSGFSFYQPH